MRFWHTYEMFLAYLYLFLFLGGEFIFIFCVSCFKLLIDLCSSLLYVFIMCCLKSRFLFFFTCIFFHTCGYAFFLSVSRNIQVDSIKLLSTLATDG